MTIDNSLNVDIKRLHDKHCVVTYHCKNTDRRKFSMVTPHLIARGIRQLIDNKEAGVPNSELIYHDCDKAFDSIYTIYLSNRDITAELVDRKRDRYSKE